MLRPALLLLSLCILAQAEPAPVSGNTIPSLPEKEVESAYRNGDLDSVVIYIKRGRSKPIFLDRGDSLIAFKYLGVIYSTDPQTREKGRYYFNQLLRKEPKASITELLPGETARTIFKEVREEFFELNPNLVPLAGPPQAVAPIPDSSGSAPAKAVPSAPAIAAMPRKKRSWTWLWISGGVMATGATAAVVLIDPPSKTFKLND